MKNLKKIAEKIERLRERMTDLILVREDLTDRDIVRVSKLLDKALNEYNSVAFNGFCTEMPIGSRKIG